MMKRLCALIFCLFLLIPAALADTSYPLIIEDEADLLTPLEESRLQEAMAPLNQYGAVAFWSTRQSGNTDYKAERYFDSRISPSTQYSGVVFMIDMANREIYLFTRGDIESKVGRAGAYGITDNVYTYASAGNYYECARSAFEQVLTLTEGGSVFSPMRVICNLLLGVSVGLTAAYLVIRSSSVRPVARVQSDLMNAKASVSMTVGNKRLLQSTKRRRESSTHRVGGGFSGGGGGHSGGGGGGHHGGGSGGGHGF